MASDQEPAGPVHSSEVQDVMRRALQLEREKEEMLDEETLREIAREAGIDPDNVVTAMAQLREDKSASRGRLKAVRIVLGVVVAMIVLWVIIAQLPDKDVGKPVEWGDSSVIPRTDGGEEVAIVLPQDPCRISIVQRQSRIIPGSNSRFHISLGDITGGRVLLSVHYQHNKRILGPATLKAGDAVAFRVGGKAYYITVRELHNVLIGNDVAELEISCRQGD